MRFRYGIGASASFTCVALAVSSLGADPAPALGPFYNGTLVQRTEFGVTLVRVACWNPDKERTSGSLFGETCLSAVEGGSQGARAPTSSLRREQGQQPVRFVPSGTPGPSPAPTPPNTEASASAPVLPAVRGTLTLPGGAKVEALLQRYGAQDAPRFVFWPAKAGDHWAIAADMLMVSPGGGWLAPALGDLDGDGRDDLVFVASGVGTCGGEPTSECPRHWLELRTTAKDLSGDLVLLTLGGLRLFEWLVGDQYGAWNTTIAPGRIEVRYQGSTGAYTWKVARTGDRLVVQNPIR